MRDIVSCFTEKSVNISQYSSCSSSHSSNDACIISPTLVPSLQNQVSAIYKVVLSTEKTFLVRVTWCKNQTGQGLIMNFSDNEDDDPSTCFKLNTNLRFFRKKKGSKVIESKGSKIEVFWDLSTAKYEAGPEPVLGFYILIIVDSEISLILGDFNEETVAKRFKTTTTSVAKVSLISRQEHCSGNTLYSTKAQFFDTGSVHDVVIRFSGENEGLKHPFLSVYIDKKMVIRVKKLRWNFRGNQTIFVDGLSVDLMWDVYDWFFKPVNGSATFMFRTRSGLDSRIWLEEKFLQKDHDRHEFSLLIYASKNT